MALVEFDEKRKSSNKKKLIADFLKSQGIMEDKDTGQIVIHVNEGGITKIFKNVEVLKT